MNRSQLRHWGRLLASAILLPVAIFACDPRGAIEAPIERDLPQIVERDTLVLLTTFNSTSYFLYRGTAMGFEFEVMQAFAEDTGLNLQTVVVRDRDQMFGMLRRGEGDVSAGRLVPLRDDREHVAFTTPLYRTAAAIIQQEEPLAQADLSEPAERALGARDPLQVRAREITTVQELEDATVHVARGTAPHARLLEVSDQLTGDVHVVAVEATVRDEALIRDVVAGEIELVATHEDLAKLTGDYYDNITVQPVVGDSFGIALGVRENSPELLAALDQWIEANGDRVSALYRKYYIDRRGYQARIESEYLTSETGRLSDFDDLLRAEAPRVGWDWRLLAAQAYQESRFDPRARSWAGAMGLLQLMPATAREHGVTDPWDPQDNVAGGVRFIGWLTNYWNDIIIDEEQRLRFILASYNTGHGHVEDARRLTAKHGGNDQVWDDVAFWLLQKSKREVYTDPVVRYGFSRGMEPVSYVKHILERYAHYQEFVTDGAGSG